MAARWSNLRCSGISIIARLFSPKAADTCRVVPVASPTQRFHHPLTDLLKNYRRSLSSTTPELYFTASGRCEIIDKSGCMTLAEAFKKQRGRYFAYTGSTIYCFSKLSIDIFSQIAAIAFQKAIKEKQFFSFNANSILLKEEGLSVTVCVPMSDIAIDGKKTIYTDRVVGPLATLMYTLYDGSSNAQAKKYQYKEVLDLLRMSQDGSKWWTTLDHILGHAVFWPVEKKLAAIISANMRVGPGKMSLKHGIPGIKPRVRVHSKAAFVNALENFYQKVYTVHFIDGEYKVTCCTDPNRDWKKEFKGAFHPQYHFGSAKDPVPVRIVTFGRNILVHFPDKNFEAFVQLLKKQTVAVAAVELDRKFSLCLAIFHAFNALCPQQ